MPVLRKALRACKRLLLAPTDLAPLVSKEVHSKVRVPWLKRMRMWSQGFLSESYVIYEAERNPLRAYLNDYRRFLKAGNINGSHFEFLDDKLAFHSLLAKHVPQPVIYALVVRGRICPIENGFPTGDDAVALMASQGAIVLKPQRGGGGAGFLLAKRTAQGWSVNGQPKGEGDFLAMIAALDHYLVVEHVRQARYASEIYPETTNTIRLLTMIDPDSQQPFAATAVQRIGTSGSFPVDNWTQGGLSCAVNIETGELGPGVTYPYDGHLRWHTCHPETGQAIAAVHVPRWPQIVKRILEAAAKVPFLQYVGWDIVVTDDDFCVIEGNNNTDVNLLQVHGPLLKDPRVVRFYRKHNVIR